MDIRQSLSLLADGRDLSLDEMKDVMSQIMSGEATDAQIGGLPDRDAPERGNPG